MGTGSITDCHCCSSYICLLVDLAHWQYLSWFFGDDLSGTMEEYTVAKQVHGYSIGLLQYHAESQNRII